MGPYTASQADVLEGLAQLVTTRLNDVMQELIQAIQREILISLFGMSEQRSKKLQKFLISANCISFPTILCLITDPIFWHPVYVRLLKISKIT